MAKTPGMYLDAGADAINAGRYAYWTGGAMCLLAAILLWFGLNAGTPVIAKRTPLARQLYAGIRAGLDNPKLMLAYFAAVIGRGDLVIITAYIDGIYPCVNTGQLRVNVREECPSNPISAHDGGYEGT